MTDECRKEGDGIENVATVTAVSNEPIKENVNMKKHRFLYFHSISQCFSLWCNNGNNDNLVSFFNLKCSKESLDVCEVLVKYNAASVLLFLCNCRFTNY